MGIEMLEVVARNMQDVDDDLAVFEIINQSGDKIFAIVGVIESRIHQIHAQDAKSFLLLQAVTILHTHMKDDVVKRPLGMFLKTNAHPTMAEFFSIGRARGHGVGKSKELRVRTA